ncbi:Swt1 family HEPN domain-containing protein, partial [Lachnospira sp.]|uniref:Swt1 family HEPN domain-containing protein n=1 Tax=Lachnospira sp. TaxID=2049031 RepID=UPI00257CD70A
MDDSYIIGKMNSFMHILSDHLCSWLYRKLPALSDDWWDELVYGNLSYLQQQQITNNNILELRELDLAALLRVFYRNWYIITSKYYIKDEVRSSVKEMMEVRNEWAHITSSKITKDKVENDVNLIIDLIHIFDGKLKDTRELSRFLIDIEDDNELKQYEEKDESSDIDNINVSDKSIKNNSIVSLVS